ncbi:hypothetical protein AFE_1051 [Acidithiobacillus ferrooxidans ATCC 23270]|uniref:Uncharacterized protein n=1 Tax=Acidithiobacillus ferrooxidans (strain ATCC 23270 / DSM 14882 / CIP 104768 / NCIMB 8455) TaxID=243159 RepID=B7J7Z9_ACIF2|nr:hypothetical protein AFE_1051 [Acidithiobacillus ferrooxidans ATCC 23270]
MQRCESRNRILFALQSELCGVRLILAVISSALLRCRKAEAWLMSPLFQKGEQGSNGEGALKMKPRRTNATNIPIILPIRIYQSTSKLTS